MCAPPGGPATPLYSQKPCHRAGLPNPNRPQVPGGVDFGHWVQGEASKPKLIQIDMSCSGSSGILDRGTHSQVSWVRGLLILWSLTPWFYEEHCSWPGKWARMTDEAGRTSVHLSLPSSPLTGPTQCGWILSAGTWNWLRRLSTRTTCQRT